MSTYDLTKEYINYDILKTGDIINVPYSGIVQKIELPPGTYKLEVWGASGSAYALLSNFASNISNIYSYYPGGAGGYSVGELKLQQYTTLFCYSGGSAITTYYSNNSNRERMEHQFNGGGARNGGRNDIRGPGGGGSDIRIGTDSLYARVIVAGGGSSASKQSYADGRALPGPGRYGGGLEGQPGTGYSGQVIQNQGTQTSAGPNAGFGYGADNNDPQFGWFTSCGGGGWYGGGWGKPGDSNPGSQCSICGGGSGYVYTSATAVNYPDGCLLNSDYYLINAQTIAGNQTITDPNGSSVIGHMGPGYCRITVLKVYNLSYIYSKNQTNKKVTSAIISTPPTTTSYSNGSRFNPEGMQLAITYNDNTTETIAPIFKNSDMPILSTGQTSVKLCYTCNENGVVLTQPIVVN